MVAKGRMVAPTPFVLQLVTPLRTLLLCAEDETAAFAWLHAMRAVCTPPSLAAVRVLKARSRFVLPVRVDAAEVRREKGRDRERRASERAREGARGGTGGREGSRGRESARACTCTHARHAPRGTRRTRHTPYRSAQPPRLPPPRVLCSPSLSLARSPSRPPARARVRAGLRDHVQLGVGRGGARPGLRGLLRGGGRRRELPDARHQVGAPRRRGQRASSRRTRTSTHTRGRAPQ
jgi:hypothetical protein